MHVGDDNQFLRTLTDRLTDCFSQKIKGDITECPKGLYYQYFILIKSRRYSSIDLCCKFRKALSNFRCSSHNLMIEEGRQLEYDREYTCSAQSRNRDNSRIVLDKVGILTLSGEVGNHIWHGSILELSLRKVGIGTKWESIVFTVQSRNRG